MKLIRRICTAFPASWPANSTTHWMVLHGQERLPRRQEREQYSSVHSAMARRGDDSPRADEQTVVCAQPRTNDQFVHNRAQTMILCAGVHKYTEGNENHTPRNQHPTTCHEWVGSHQALAVIRPTVSRDQHRTMQIALTGVFGVMQQVDGEIRHPEGLCLALCKLLNWEG